MTQLAAGSGEPRVQPLTERELEGYRKLAIEIYTHAIAGLSENDFILAAKITPLADQP